MQRITITIDDDLLELVDTLMRRQGYASRSEAIRDILRDMGNREQAQKDETVCIATLSYIFDYETRDLAQRLTRAQHGHHDLIVSSMRVPLDHSSCQELVTLKGRSDAIRGFADEVTTQRGVRHANLHLVPVRVSATRHRHDKTGAHHEHLTA